MGFQVNIDTNGFKFQSKMAGWLFKRKIEKLNNDPDVMHQLIQVIAEQSDPYVPYKTGKLSKNIVVTKDGINYLQPYAIYQYYGEHYRHPLDGPHPLARHHWVAYALEHDRDTIYAKWRQVIIRNWFKV